MHREIWLRDFGNAVQLGQFAADIVQSFVVLRFLFAFVQQHGGRRSGLGEVRVQAVFINVRKERGQFIKVGLGQRVVLVIVAAATFKRQTQKCRYVRNHSVR